MPSVAEKRRAFRALHETGCFVIPNPWDVGSARYLQSLGFKALATTSSGAAWSLGYADGAVPLDEMLAHIGAIATASDVPVNADFLGGFAVEPDTVAANVRRCADTGVAGLSIEDTASDGTLFDFDLAVARMRAARAATGDALLIGRSDVYFTGHADPLQEAIRRLKAFAVAGADCLFAPGAVTRDEISALVAAVAPKPLNVLIGSATDLTVADIAALGVRRISTGGALARMAWAGFQSAATEIAGQGTFGSFKYGAQGRALNDLFTADAPRRPK